MSRTFPISLPGDEQHQQYVLLQTTRLAQILSSQASLPGGNTLGKCNIFPQPFFSSVFSIAVIFSVLLCFSTAANDHPFSNKMSQMLYIKKRLQYYRKAKNLQRVPYYTRTKHHKALLNNMNVNLALAKCFKLFMIINICNGVRMSSTFLRYLTRLKLGMLICHICQVAVSVHQR